MWRSTASAIGVFGLLLACGAPEEGGDGHETPAGIEIGGAYRVTGVTIGSSSGEERPLQGHVSLVVSGDRYTTHFELDTVFPGSHATPASIVGTGEGSVDGAILEGTAELQIVASTVPGVDVGFAYIPRAVSSRVVSTTEAEFLADGSVRIRIENRGAEGEDYEPTTTQLVGYRVEDD